MDLFPVRLWSQLANRRLTSVTSAQLDYGDSAGLRAAYRERLEAVAAAAERFCRGRLRLRAVQTGLHAVADVDGVDAVRVSREAATRGVEATPLSAYFVGRARATNSLVLGFAAVPPDAAGRGMERLASAIEAARRS